MSDVNLDSLINRNSSAPYEVDTDRLVVVGAGTMGRGISMLAARKGIEVLLIEKSETSLEKSLNKISENIDHEIARWAMTESDKRAILTRIKGAVDFSEISDQHFILEALPEKLDLKMAVFKELDRYCVPEAIFITNTSTLSITEIAVATERYDRVIGMHFLAPVSKVKLIEVVKGLNTSAVTFHLATVLADRLERTAVEVFESPGYITTRVMMPLVNEAVQVLMEGIATADDIDTAIRIGYEIPRGPLTMADAIGLDQVLSWLDTLFNDLGDSKYRPCPLLRMLVRAGHLGVKTGRGFFRYDSEGNQLPGSGQAAAAYERFLK